MKIAVCFSGKTRNFEDTYPYFKKNLFDKFDTDVFVYGVPNKNGYEQNLNKLVELYSPKKIILNDEKYYKNIKEKYNFNIPFIQMWHNIYNANKLRETYEDKGKFKYDYVFRLRFDCFFLSSLEQCEINLNDIDHYSVAIPHKWNFSNVHQLAKSDVFAIGTSLSMTKYCELYEKFDEYVDSIRYPNHHCGGPHPESLLGIHLNNVNIRVIQTKTPIEFEYPDEINLPSKELSYRSNYRKTFDT
jgi:hypothetical protein